MTLLKRGLSGEPVRRLQEKLGIEADGIFGGGTATALKEYQGANGLVVDGIAGPDTFMAMGLHELIVLRKGSRGQCVKMLQQELNIGDDGIFGSGTEKHVKAFQEAKGLYADGIAGPDTLAEMDIFEDINQDVVERSFLPAQMPAIKIPDIFSAKAEDDDKADVPEEVAEVVKAAEEKEAKTGKRGIWGTVRGLFGR